MRREFAVLRLVLCLLASATLLAPGAGAGQDLKPSEPLSATVFRAGGEPRTYSRLRAGEQASYLFCGQGKLKILSRAVMARKAGAARYTLDLTIDGAAPGREVAYRVPAAAGATFDQQYRAGALRRASIDLARGCHIVELSLARSTIEAVAVRLTWQPREATRRRWSDARISTGGRPVRVEVGNSRSLYHLLEAGQPLELSVDGPAWVRLLVRPAGFDHGSYALEVERSPRRRANGARGKSYRAYRIDTSPSRRARLSTAPGLVVGKANEVVFAVGRDRRHLVLRAAQRLLIRPQVAERTGDRLPGSQAPAWTTRARLAGFYDSNILRYSDKFIRRFDNGEDPDRFRVESLDDTVVRADLYLRRGFAGLGGKPAEAGVGIEHWDYQRNDIKDRSRFSATWQQELRHGRLLAASINFAPSFYVRHLRDSDLTGSGSTVDPFQAFEFERAEARLRLSQELGASLTARYHLGAASFRHTPAFREFDSTNLFGGVRLDQQLSRRARLSYAFEYTDSSARGYDQPGEALATSDDTDPAYRQLDLMLAARFRVPGKRRQIIFLQAESGQREYTTNKSTDSAPLHAGREDDLLRLFASWQLDLSKRYRLTVFGQSRERSSTAPIDLDIGVEKDYEQWEAGIRVSAKLGD